MLRLRPLNSLRNRLSAGLALVLLAVAALLAAGLQEFPRRLVEGYVLSRLEHDAALLYARVHDAPDPAAASDAVQRAAGTVYDLPLSGHYFRIVNDTGVIRSRSLWDEDLPPLPPGRAATRGTRMAGPAGQTLLAIEQAYPGEQSGWRILVAEDVSGLDAAIATFRGWLLLGLAAATLLLLALQRQLIVRGLAPLSAAIAACRRLELGEAAEIDRRAPVEVQPMLDAVNRLVHHQARRMSRIRHAAGNLSHSLKTPLAVLGQLTDQARARGQPDLADALLRQIDIMQGSIDRELRRARIAGSGSPGAGFDAESRLQALAQALMRLHASRAVEITVTAPARRLPVDAEDMLELFGNLLDNACKWATRRVRLEMSAPEEADRLHFTVEDDGPGVPAELLDRLEAPGFRADENRPGHGLGLSIVADIVSQYGGEIRYLRSPDLGGLRVEGQLVLNESLPGISPPGDATARSPRPASSPARRA